MDHGSPPSALSPDPIALLPALPPLVPLAPDTLAAAADPALDTIAAWVRDYLCQPHPALGRDGPMCPFVPKALQKRLLVGTVHRHVDGPDLDAIMTSLVREMERFIEMEPVSGNEAQYKSLMVLFPNLPEGAAYRVIEEAQAALQPRFVPNGLMVGEFHGAPPDKRGLWNSDFKPLWSPVPMLVIRHMVPTDVLFLKDDPQLFREYSRIYGNAVPERFRPQYEEAARRFGIAIDGDDTVARGAPRIMQALADAGVRHRVYRHDDFEQPIRAPKDFAAALGVPLSRISKTLFVKCRDSGRCFLIVCGMDRRVDLHAIATLLGSGRLEMASLAELQRHVGYPPTSVAPIAVDGIPVYMDERLFAHPTILIGSGVPRVEIELAPDDLAALCGAVTTAMV